MHRTYPKPTHVMLTDIPTYLSYFTYLQRCPKKKEKEVLEGSACRESRFKLSLRIFHE